MTIQYFWVTIVGFAAGVFLASITPLSLTFAGALAVIAIGIFFAVRETLFSFSTLAVIALIACSLGVVRMSMATRERSVTLDTMLGLTTTVEGIVFREPDTRENSTRLYIHTNDANLLVVAPFHTNIEYGDRVRAEGKLGEPQKFTGASGRTFNYPGYLAQNGILYELSFATIERLEGNDGNMLVRGVLWIKQKYLEGLALALPEPSAGLAGGITVGDKRSLGSELSETFRTTALIHIVVLSGYNIMIVIHWLGKLFSFASQRVRFGIGAATAIAFVVMTGAAAPSVRAAAMALIGMAGRMTKRSYIAIRALAVVAIGMILWNPHVLAFDPGFQLSVIATWGIVSITPILMPRLSSLAHSPTLQEIAASTIATQVAVLPLLLYQSGTFSLYALPANLLALIMLPFAMFFSFVASIAGLLLGPLAPIIAFPAYVLLSYIIWIANIFAHLPFASVSVGTISFVWIVIAYAILLGAARCHTKQKS